MFGLDFMRTFKTKKSVKRSSDCSCCCTRSGVADDRIWESLFQSSFSCISLFYPVLFTAVVMCMRVCILPHNGQCTKVPFFLVYVEPRKRDREGVNLKNNILLIAKCLYFYWISGNKPNHLLALHFFHVQFDGIQISP